MKMTRKMLKARIRVLESDLDFAATNAERRLTQLDDAQFALHQIGKICTVIPQGRGPRPPRGGSWQVEALRAERDARSAERDALAAKVARAREFAERVVCDCDDGYADGHAGVLLPRARVVTCGHDHGGACCPKWGATLTLDLNLRGCS